MTYSFIIFWVINLMRLLNDYTLSSCIELKTANYIVFWFDGVLQNPILSKAELNAEVFVSVNY